MTADNQGNDLDSVKNVLTSKIIVAPYVEGKTLTASQIAPSVADPITELGDVFGSSSATVGLITSDGIWMTPPHPPPRRCRSRSPPPRTTTSPAS